MASSSQGAEWRTAKYQANQPAPPGPLPGSMQLVPHGPPFMQAVPPGQWPGGPQGPMQSTLSLQQQQQQQQVPPQQQPPPQGLDDDSNGQGAEVSKSLQESRRLSIQRCIQSLVHACQCRNANCSLPSCQKMKHVVQHTKGCKRKTNGGCPICKQLIALCCYHAKHCQENKCPVPFCFNIKHKLRQQQLQERLQQAQMLRRRMASMQGRRQNLKQG